MRTLEAWAREVPAGLRRAGSVAERQLADLGQRALKAVQAHARTEKLAQSVRVEITDGEVQLSSSDPAALPLETGDTIYGRPWLAIPLTGTPDVPGPRQDPAHLFTLRARDGRLFLASRDSGVLQLHWKLQHSVEPVHHPFFRPGVEQAREGFEARLLDALTAEVM